MKSRLLSWSIGVLLLIVGLGCGTSDPTSSDGPPLDPNAKAGPPTGNAVFDKHCLGCHAATAGTVVMKNKGPNLAKVGTQHTVDWLADHVKDPRKHKPGSGMPEFASKLSEEEIKSVSEFMAGLK